MEEIPRRGRVKWKGGLEIKRKRDSRDGVVISGKEVKRGWDEGRQVVGNRWSRRRASGTGTN